MAQPAPPALPVPNIANLQAAVNGMAADRNAIAQRMQTYSAHEQQLTAELSLCANYPVGQMQQQLAQIQQQLVQTQQNIQQTVQQAVQQSMVLTNTQ